MPGRSALARLTDMKAAEAHRAIHERRTAGSAVLLPDG